METGREELMNDTIVRIKRDCTELNSLGRATISITSSPRLYLCDCTVIKDAHAPLNIHTSTGWSIKFPTCVINLTISLSFFLFFPFNHISNINIYIYWINLILIFSTISNYYCTSIYVGKKKKCLILQISI